MKWLRRILCVLVMLVVSNLVAVVCVLPLYRRTGEWQLPLAACLLVLLLILILMRPLGNVALPAVSDSWQRERSCCGCSW